MESHGTDLGGAMVLVGFITLLWICVWLFRGTSIRRPSRWQRLVGLAIWLLEFVVLASSVLGCVGGHCQHHDETAFYLSLIAGYLAIALFLALSWRSTRRA